MSAATVAFAATALLSIFGWTMLGNELGRQTRDGVRPRWRFWLACGMGGASIAVALLYFAPVDRP